MSKISIGFSYHKDNLLSKAIMFADNSQYSHVYIRRHSKYGEYVYQASGLAVNFMNIDLFLKNNVIVEEYEFDLPEEKKDAAISFFFKHVGIPYALSVLFKNLIIIVARRFGKKLNFKGDGEDSFDCSELAAFFCEKIFEIPFEGTIDYLTPKDINPIIRKYGKRVL